MSDYPRILFVTPHAFNSVTGGGITFSNLFKGWPKDALATVHNDPEPVSDAVCHTYYRLAQNEMDYAFPFNKLRRGFGSKATGSGDSIAQPGTAVRPTLKAKIVGVLKRLMVGVLGDAIPERSSLSPELERWIADFKPEVIYTILGSNAMMRLIEDIRTRFDLPLVVHIMDDWTQAYHRNGLLAPLQRREMERWVQHFFDVAAVRMGISPAMCAAYEERYGHQFVPFQNVIDTTLWSKVVAADQSISQPADILYVGSIFPNAQLTSLIECCRAVVALNDRGMNVRMTISSPSGHTERYGDQLVTHPCIHIEDTIRDDEVFFKRIAQADILLLPVNFDEESVRFIRYSMPTKVPAYLTVGTPILLYGPMATAQVAYGADSKWGFVVDEQGVDGLTEAMCKLLSDMDLRNSLSTTAQRVARENHDAKNVRAQFQDMLMSVKRHDVPNVSGKH